MTITRREFGKILAGGTTAGATGMGMMPWVLAASPVAGGYPNSPDILKFLGDLELAVAELANTWKPDESHYRADVYQQIMMDLSYAYFVYFHADPEHPDWSPLCARNNVIPMCRETLKLGMQSDVEGKNRDLVRLAAGTSVRALVPA